MFLVFDDLLSLSHLTNTELPDILQEDGAVGMTKAGTWPDYEPALIVIQSVLVGFRAAFVEGRVFLQPVLE